MLSTIHVHGFFKRMLVVVLYVLVESLSVRVVLVFLARKNHILLISKLVFEILPDSFQNVNSGAVVGIVDCIF